MVGKVIVNEDKVVRPSQLIAGVRQPFRAERSMATLFGTAAEPGGGHRPPATDQQATDQRALH